MAFDWGQLFAAYGSGGGGGFGGSGGGASGYDKYAPLINAGVSLAASLAKGKQAGRETQNAAGRSAADFKQSDAALAERALENRAGIDLDRRKYADSAQDRDYSNALRAAIMGGIPSIGGATRPHGVPNISFLGGKAHDIVGAGGRAASDEMYRRALADLMSGKPTFKDLPPIERTGAPVYQGPGKMENILGAIGAGGTALGQARSASQQQNLIQDLLARSRNQSSATGGGSTLETLLDALRKKQRPNDYGPASDEDM